MILKANTANIKHLFGPEKLPGLSRDGPLALAGVLTGVLRERASFTPPHALGSLFPFRLRVTFDHSSPNYGELASRRSCRESTLAILSLDW